MKRIVVGTAVAGGAAFALPRLARKLHDRCRRAMRDGCGRCTASARG